MKFDTELTKGNFFLSECPNCQKIVWPPSEYCDQCLQEVNWRKSSGMGIILEFSKKNEQIFCVAEIENSIRLIGKIVSGLPEVGKKVIIESCSVEGQDYVLNMKVID